MGTSQPGPAVQALYTIRGNVRHAPCECVKVLTVSVDLVQKMLKYCAIFLRQILHA